MGPSLDPKFDDLMSSLGKIAHKHPKPVIDSIRRSHNENVSPDILSKHHASQSPLWTRGARVQELSTLLNERKSLAPIYITCRALIAVSLLHIRRLLSLDKRLGEPFYYYSGTPGVGNLTRERRHDTCRAFICRRLQRQSHNNVSCININVVAILLMLGGPGRMVCV
jgi:hypothetical protein